MAISKFYGYVLRNAGTPCQQWVLNELPISTISEFTSTSTAEVAINRIIPVSSIVINQTGGKVNSDGTFSLPCGLYRVSFSTMVSTAAAGQVQVALVNGTTQVFECSTNTVADGDLFTGSILGDVVIRSTGCGNEISLVNTSTVAVTPVLSGTESIRAIITRIA